MNRVRSEYNVSPGARITATVIPVAVPMALLESQASTMGSIARADVTVSGEAPTALSASVVGTLVTVHVPLAGMIDMDKERARLSAEIDQLQGPLDALLGRLSNEKFKAKAPPAVVDGERAKAAEWQARLAQLRAKLDQLGA